MLHIYYDIGECPNCGSKEVGFNIFQDFVNYRRMLWYAKRGMIVKCSTGPTDTCFCNTCGKIWYKRPEFTLKKKDFIKQAILDKNLLLPIAEYKAIVRQTRKEITRRMRKDKRYRKERKKLYGQWFNF